MAEELRMDLAQLRAEVAAKPGRDWFFMGLAAVCILQAALLIIVIPPMLREELREVLPTEAAQRAETEAIGRLVERVDALEVALAAEMAENEQFMELDEVHPIIRKTLPAALLDALVRAKLLKHVSATDFGGEEWLFMDRVVFREFSPDEQRAIAEAARDSGVRFMVR